MKNKTTEPPLPYDACNSGVFRPPVETAATILETRLEAAGRRIAAYLRHLPLPEKSRHELALMTLTALAEDPGNNPSQAEARAMTILRELLAEQPIPLFVVPGPPLQRMHMKPEEMDRRPWVRVFLRLGRPLWSMTAYFFNTRLIDIFQYALLLAGLYILDATLR
ncbi:hypothetical protein [Desulfomicrobium baculatum]|uniref:Uncharacterized protein n=1 Tax=Desulfomicrobium baculatum (strain DSM 4028 / VKM B-1378 / X) TaxID=525897 RepID=C7LX43_DESBD|nr:hypothetical protein [Desulfomicrobium baculatum]ACU88716.1 hypothetical protein Dbac_0592 [Desulfomicrobium baculatum DSM 4028]